MNFYHDLLRLHDEEPILLPHSAVYQQFQRNPVIITDAVPDNQLPTPVISSPVQFVSLSGKTIIIYRQQAHRSYRTDNYYELSDASMKRLTRVLRTWDTRVELDSDDFTPTIYFHPPRNL